ncbi:MGDG synthase family glycosyltransferase [Bacilliculturomica massiliensis]|uniref:MGDG synthase family glycosyltransferase n=1 Tax=Bacilliculturomica massiliensis TaxID=1917867 RepID=UPI00103050E6|nr:glycosyltransferase [Bacilliculturomica massiliensis]
MKVLILTGRFGMGHVSVARSLEEQILSEYGDVSVEVVDLMEYTAPKTAGFIYKAFGFLARHGRSLYNFLYKQAGKRDENEWTAFTALSMSRLTGLMETSRPDVVISTLPLSSLLVSKYKERMAKKTPGGESITLATCITDISSHSEWIQPNTDFYLVGGDLVKRQLMSKGVEGSRIIVTGIPVRRAFTEAGESGAEAPVREKRLLIMGGGLGLLPRNPEFYEQINAIPGMKTTVITGKNEKLFQMLSGRYENIEAVTYTERVDLYMRRADVVLTKPGGITLFETIFSGKPILMFTPFLQQEVNNMHFALYHNIGRVLSKKQRSWADEIRKLMNDDRAVEQMTCCVQRLRDQYRKDGLRQVLTTAGAVA